MADNLTIKDGAGANRTVKAKDAAGIHVPFHALADADGAALGAANPLPTTLPAATVTTLTPPTAAAIGGDVDTRLRATALPVSGPLTDTQLRATAVPVSGTVEIGATSLAALETITVSGTVTATGPLTDTQLRASAVPVSGPLTDAQLRATAVPVSGPATDAQMRASALAVTVGATAPYASGTREYNLAQATRTAIATSSSAAIALGTLSASREVMLMASSRCFVRFGASDVPAAADAAGCLPVATDSAIHIRVPAGVTHYTVIRATEDGALHVIPVA